MNKMAKVTAGLLASALTILVPNLAQAETGDVSVKVDPGVAVPFTQPQVDHFNAGVSGNAKLLLGVNRYVAVAPTISTLVLSSKLSGQDAGTAWGGGVGVLVRRPLDNDDAPSLFISPWIDADFQYVKTGDLARPTFSVGVGAAFPLTDNRDVWVGPFLRYQNIFAVDNSSNIDSRDAKIGIMGLSFEFGVTDIGHKPQEVKVVPQQAPVTKTTVTPPPVPNPQVQPTSVEKSSPFEIKQKIQFSYNSSVLQSGSTATLNDIAQSLKDHPNYNVTVEGFASSEGDAEYNRKLSLLRAQSVVDFLSHSIDKNRLTAVGMGVINPVADNATEAGRKANRRVEFVTIVVTVNGISK